MSGPILAGNERNLIVVSAGRSGSSLLVNYLNCNRQIHCHGEILNSAHKIYGTVEGKTPEEVLRHVASFFSAGDTCYMGAKFLTHQFEELDLPLPAVLETLRRPKVIVLYRRSLLETYLSLLIAEQTGLWYSTGMTGHASVKLDIEQFKVFAAVQRRRWQRAMEDISRLCPFLCTSYEEVTRNCTAAMNRIFSFIEITPVMVYSESVKQNPGSLMDKISNASLLRPEDLEAAATLALEIE